MSLHMYIDTYVLIHVIVLTEAESELLSNPVVLNPVTAILNRVSSGNPVKLWEFILLINIIILTVADDNDTLYCVILHTSLLSVAFHDT